MRAPANRGLWEFLDTEAVGGLVLLAHTAVALLATVLVWSLRTSPDPRPGGIARWHPIRCREVTDR